MGKTKQIKQYFFYEIGLLEEKYENWKQVRGEKSSLDHELFFCKEK